MLCPSCGIEVPENSDFCHKCGDALPDIKNPTGTSSASITANRSDDEWQQQAATSPRDKLQATADREQYKPEEDLWQGAYSMKAMADLIFYITLGFITIWIVVLIQNFTAQSVSYLLIATLAAAIVIYLIYLYRKLNISYHLTNLRFIHEKGILRRVSDRIEVIDMDDTTVSQKFVERFFGVGTIKITSSDRTHPEILLIGIANVKEVCELIDRARREERERRGLHIEAI